MEKILPFYKCLSHPDRLLSVHLEETHKSSDNIIKSISYNFKDIQKQDIEYILKITTLLHDIGKATFFFQNYLINKKKSKFTSHSYFSAIISYFVSKHFIKIPFLNFLVYLTINNHHGNLSNFSDEINLFFTEEDFDIFEKQLTVTDVNGLENFIRKKFNITFNIIQITREKVKREKFFLRKYFRGYAFNIENYIFINFLFSILIFSDKYNAIYKNIYISTNKTYPLNAVENHINKLNYTVSELNKMRNKLFNQIRLFKINKMEKIYSIALPTGTGKTLLTLEFALRLKKELGSDYKIIYSLPFLSIIEQNFQVYQKVFSKKQDILSKNHHLTTFQNTTEEYIDYEKINKLQFELETWENEIILTTFVQLFNTIFSSSNKMLKRYFKLSNKIIIIDEIQAIPYRFWKPLSNMLLLLSNIFNTYFILSSATLPDIIPNKKDLFPDTKEIYSSINRTVIKKADTEFTIEEFIDYFLEEFNKNNEKSVIIMVNTIKASIEIYNALKKELKSVHFFYLSTNIIPEHRLKRINEFKKNQQGEKILITTQVIEAGVDINAEKIYRDFAPLDSINQTAGRCNREGKNNKKGEIILIKLKKDEKYLSSFIYDSFLINKTNEVLSNYTAITENNFLSLIQKYFTYINKDTDDTLETEIKNLNYENISNKFKLIKHQYNYVDVFININQNSDTIWNKFINIQNLMDRYKRKTVFLNIKKEFYSYVISVPKKYTNGLTEIFENFYYLSNEQLYIYYEIETGYKRIEDSTVIF